MSHPLAPTLGRRQLFGIAGAAAVVVGLGSSTGCSPKTSASGSSHLRISASDGSTNDSIDPLRLERHMQNLCASMIFEPLVDIDMSMQPVGRLAESFETPDDGVTWDFKLHSGVLMHDGSPLTPEDVIFCISRALDPTQGSGNSLAGQLKGILRPEGITAVDDRTVRFKLDQKYVFFPSAMATRFSRIYKAGSTDFASPVGTGPYKFESFKPGRSFAATRFDKYWGEAPGVERVEVNHYPEESTRLSAFLDGDDDVMFNLESTSAHSVTGTDGITLLEEKNAVWIPFALDTSVEPFNKPEISQAIKLAVDREQLVKNGLGGYGSIGYDTPIPADDRFFGGLPAPARDLAAAKDLLAQAGYANGLTLPALEVLDHPSVVSLALLLQQQLKDVGITFDVKRITPATFWSESWLKKPFYSNTYTRRSTADEILKLCFSSNGAWNMSKRKDPEIDAAIAAAGQTTDVEEQKKQYVIAQRLIADRDSTVIAAHTSRLSGIAANVSGVTTNPVHLLDLRKAGLSK